MSGRDDDPKQEVRRGSIPAPASVPRPSRPPPAPAARASNPPPSNRKGTLNGIHPSQVAATSAAAASPATPTSARPAPPRPAPQGGFGYAEPTEDDFDAEKTMVVDPDDAPTADYDPRSHGPGSVGTPDLSRPLIPAAPQAPIFDASGVPAPRPSEAGRRRTSRRTVKIPDDNVRARAAAMMAEPSTDGTGPAAPAAAATVPLSPAAEGSPPAPEADFNDAEEITVVQALRIISVGSDPPPPITSAIATWPPPAHLTFEPPIEAGWTPAAPMVAPLAEGAGQGAARLEPPEVAIEHKDEHEGLDISERISELPPGGADEILEEIEPDAMPFAAPAAQPKRPPPPPPKPARAAEAKPEAARPQTEPPKAKPWWEDIFSDEYIRTHDRLDAKVARREVDFIEESLGMERHAVVLDLACGMGDHAVELAARGYNVVGFDYSSGMLKIADQKLKARAATTPGVNAPTLVQGDMRELPYEEAFDGVYCWGTSLGYFDEEKNLAVLQRVHRALRQGGMFLIDMINRDYVAPRSPSLVWFEGKQCVCMDDMYIDFFTSRMRVKRTAMFEGGLSRELDYSIRLYTLHELGTLLHQVGFKVIEVTGHTAHPGVFFGTESPRLIVLAERS